MGAIDQYLNTANVVLLGSVIFFGGAAVYALSWAAKDGQFENFDRSAQAIFDPDEPIGESTDVFPGLALKHPASDDLPAAIARRFGEE